MQYFYMMVGLPGSGKSVYAGKLPDAVIHSSDAIREEVLGNISTKAIRSWFSKLFTSVFCVISALEKMSCTMLPILTSVVASSSYLV